MGIETTKPTEKGCLGEMFSAVAVVGTVMVENGLGGGEANRVRLLSPTPGSGEGVA